MKPEKLKKGWRSWRFDQMAVMVNDRIDNPAEADVEHYVGLEHLDPESLTIRRWGTPSDVEATKLLLRRGDIIFGRRRVYQRKLAVARFDGICSAHAMVLRAKPEVVLSEFLPFFMQSDLFMERAKQISVGSLSPTINWKTLAKEEFALPPMDEQRRIAEALTHLQITLDRFHDAKIKAINLLESLREYIFIDSKPTRRLLGEIATVRYGLGQPPAEDPKGVPMIRATNIDHGRIIARDMLRIDANAVPASRRAFLNYGEILLVRSGAYTGDSAMISKEWVGAVAGYDLVIASDNTKVHPAYLANYLLARRTVISDLRSLSARTAQPHLNADDVAGLTVPCPDIAVQSKAVEQMSRIESGIQFFELNIDKLVQLKNPILFSMGGQ